MKRIATFAAASMLLSAATSSQAETFYTNTNLQVLTGSGYTTPFGPDAGEESDGTMFTFQHFGAYDWGKVLMFMDRFKSGDKEALGDDSFIKIAPDISLTGGKGFADSIIKDIYLTTIYEQSQPNNTDNYAAGFGVTWNIPGITFLDTNIYLRDNGNTPFEKGIDNNYQFTVAWDVPFNIGVAKFSFGGFTHFVTSADFDGGNLNSTIQAQPNLKLDLGNFWNQPNKYLVGFELDYWQNKFGGDEDQAVLQAMAQVNF